MNTFQSQVCVAELQTRADLLRKEIEHMKIFLNNFPSTEIAKAILEEKGLLRKELTQLPKDTTDYAQNIKTRQMIIESRLLIEQGKKKRLDLERLIDGFKKILSRANKRNGKRSISCIRYQCLQQIVEVAEFSIDSMTLSLQSQILHDKHQKYLAEQRIRAVSLKIKELQQRFKDAKKVIEDRLKTWQVTLEETTKEISARLDQEKEHTPLVTQNRSHQNGDLLGNQIPEHTPDNSKYQPRFNRPEAPRPETTPQEPNNPWKLFLVHDEWDKGVELPNNPEQFSEKIRGILDKSYYQGIETRIVFEKLTLEMQRIDQQCATCSRIVGHKFKNWIKAKAGLNYRILILPDRNMRHIKFFLYPKKIHKQVLAQ